MSGNSSGLTPAHFFFTIGIVLGAQVLEVAAGRIWPAPAPVAAPALPSPIDQVALEHRLVRIETKLDDIQATLGTKGTPR